MGGNKLKKYRKHKIKRAKTLVLFLILIPLVFLDISFLRLDHKKMTRLRDNVIQADKDGDAEKISEALKELSQFTFSHIVINVVEENGTQKIFFGTAPFYLEQSYLRAAETAIKNAEEKIASTTDENPNGNVYQIASNTCRPQAIAHGWAWYSDGYVNCMTSIINQYPSAEELTNEIYADIPSTELYRRNYASPIWAPCLTGFAILITLIIVAILIIRILIWAFLQIVIFFI